MEGGLWVESVAGTSEGAAYHCWRWGGVDSTGWGAVVSVRGGSVSFSGSRLLSEVVEWPGAGGMFREVGEDVKFEFKEKWVCGGADKSSAVRSCR